MHHAQNNVSAFPVGHANRCDSGHRKAAVSPSRHNAWPLTGQQATAPGFTPLQSQLPADQAPCNPGTGLPLDELMSSLAAVTHSQRIAPDLAKPAQTRIGQPQGVKSVGDLSPSQRQAVIASLRRSILTAAPEPRKETLAASRRRLKMASLAVLLGAGAIGSGLLVVDNALHLPASPAKITAHTTSSQRLSAIPVETLQADYTPVPVTTVAVSDPPPTGLIVPAKRRDSTAPGTVGSYIPQFRLREGESGGGRQALPATAITATPPPTAPVVATSAPDGPGKATSVRGQEQRGQEQRNQERQGPQALPPSSSHSRSTGIKSGVTPAAGNLAAAATPAKLASAQRRQTPPAAQARAQQPARITADARAGGTTPLELKPNLASANPPTPRTTAGVRSLWDNLFAKADAGDE